MAAEVSIGLLKQIGFYLWDLILMPSRIARLAENKAKIDKRLMDCPNCDLRMKIIKTSPYTDGRDFVMYECGKCTGTFQMTFKAHG